MIRGVPPTSLAYRAAGGAPRSGRGGLSDSPSGADRARRFRVSVDIAANTSYCLLRDQSPCAYGSASLPPARL